MPFRRAHRVAIWTALIYAVVAGVWILWSDQALLAVAGDRADIARLETYKGWAFVAVTALILYFGLRMQLRSRAAVVSERDRAEADLKQRLSLAVGAGGIGLWEYDLGSRAVYWSPEWKHLVGYGDDEIPNRIEEFNARLHPDDRERVRQALRRSIDNPAGGYREEFRLRHRDGTYRWILSQGAVETDPGTGKAVRLRGSHVDVTTGKLAELALRERAEMNSRLVHIAAVVPGAIVSLERRSDGSTAFPYATRAVEDIYGVSCDEMARDAGVIFSRIHVDDRAEVTAAIEESARTMSPWRSDFRFNHPKKGEIWIEGYSLPERRADGTLLWNGFVMDITARKQAELRIEHLNRVYAVLTDINQTIVRVREPQALFEAVCRIAVEKGQFRMAWVGRCDQDESRVVPVASAGHVDGYLDGIAIELLGAAAQGPTARAFASGRHVVCNDIERERLYAPWREAALRRGFRSSASLPIHVHNRVAHVLNIYAATPNAFNPEKIGLLDEMTVDLSFALEVSEREAGILRTEASSRESEERFRQLAENVHEVFWLTDPDTRRILYVSPVYQKVWGRTVESLYANPRLWYDSVHAEDRQRVIRAAVEQQAAGAYDLEYRIVRPDGAVRWIRARAFPVRDAGGNVYRIAGVAEDITDRKLLEQQFFRAQRLEAIGTLASGIAHDLNNILAPIMMCAPMLRMSLPPVDFEKMLGTIESSTRRGADLVRQLLVFGRGVEGGRGPVNTRDLVLEMLKIACETFPKNIVVRPDVPDGLWTVTGDATQLHQVLLNLCVNARDAMPDGGELTVGAENIELGAGSATPYPNPHSGPYVRLRVRDTGMGIAPDVVDKIFDPFFTTKPPGKGTGLGLSTVVGIVKSHGGFVRLDSEVGQGATFFVYLPAKTQAAETAEAKAAGDGPAGHDELVLLVEDEQSIRDVVADLLVRQNYRVMTAEDGLEGETLYRENRDDISVIVTDLDMPRMDGFRFIESVRKTSAHIPVIVSTGLKGGRQARETTDLEQLGVATVLEKPYGAGEILAAVRAALGAAKAK